MPEPYGSGPVSHVDAAGIEFLCKEAGRCPPGCFVEFGVYKGGSAFHLAAVALEQRRNIYLFDTFCGMPFKDPEKDRVGVGAFHCTSIAEVKAIIPYAIFCPGVFPASMVELPPIAFAQIDCDQYQSIRDACRVFGPLMVEGCVMLFDDYVMLAGARMAVKESFGDRAYIENEKAVVRF